MIRNLPEKQLQDESEPAKHARPYSLHAVLWFFWTLAIVATGYRSWHADVVAQRSFNLLGLIIHCTVMGIIGLVVLTMIELRLERWRFLN